MTAFFGAVVSKLWHAARDPFVDRERSRKLVRQGGDKFRNLYSREAPVPESKRAGRRQWKLLVPSFVVAPLNELNELSSLALAAEHTQSSTLSSQVSSGEHRVCMHAWAGGRRTGSGWSASLSLSLSLSRCCAFGAEEPGGVGGRAPDPTAATAQ